MPAPVRPSADKPTRWPMPAGSQDRTETFIVHRLNDELSDIFIGCEGTSPVLSPIRSFAEQPVLIGYMRVSKADGSQTLDLQRAALLAAGVEPGYLYEDQASGRRDNRPCLAACLKALCGRATRWWRGNSIGSAATCATWSISSMI